MKKTLSSIIAVAIAICTASAQGQQTPQLPNDPAVKTGKLDNGLTYYIRHNDKPAQRAEFYLATNVGAIQETPDQDGLAHFLEHMCFNGTKNFPGKDILNWLQSIGASFGGNVNASTGVEETQYMLNNIPLVRESVIDTCLLIMHDYSHFVLNEQEELDKERGVIIEERRSRRDASWRMFEKSLPYYYGDSKYATCTLIGSQENLETFKRESIVNFYQTWYRPDLQAIIVVGDVDVDSVERKIKDIFSDIPAAENPKPKDVIKVPVKESRIGVVTDPEATVPTITIMSQDEAQSEEINSTATGMMLDIIKSFISSIMSERFNDITSKADAPFLYGSVGIGNLCESVEAVMCEVSLKEDDIMGGYSAFLEQIEKMHRFGFTQAEFNRAKEKMLTRYEAAANQADSRKNSEFVWPLIQNFFDNEAYMEPQQEYEIAKALLGQINVDIVNMIVAQDDFISNPVIIYQGPEKEGVQTPAPEQLKAAYEESKAKEIEAPVQENANATLMDDSKLKGSKVKKIESAVYGSTQWTLKNGVKVIVLPTEYKKDQILINIEKDGGSSLISTEDLASFESSIYGMFSEAQGVAGIKGTELSKMLAGKRVSVSPFINSLHHGISASSNAKDLETAFQLIYLYYTQPYFDQEEFDNATSQLKAVLPNVLKQPNFIFSQKAMGILYNNDPRYPQISEELLEKASLQTIGKNYRKLFADAGGAVMVITGDVVPETIKPLVEKYIGSLPKGKKATKWIDNVPQIVKGEIEEVFAQDMETPMTTVMHVYSYDKPYSVEESVNLDAVKYILDQIYTETLREDEGGTYGSSVSASSTYEPQPKYLVQVYFNSKPALADKLRVLAKKGLRDLAENGPTDEQFTRTVENFKKNIPEQRINNSYWLNNIVSYCRNGIDRDGAREEAVGKLSKEGIQAVAKTLVDSGNFIEVVMKPGETSEKE